MVLDTFIPSIVALGLVWVIVLFLVTVIIIGIPLHISVSLLGGSTSLLKSGFIVLITTFITGLTTILFRPWGSFIGFLITLLLYRETFRLKWWKTVVVWFLQFVVLMILTAVFGFLLANLF
ncbi:MAG: hypothetical protein ACMXYK_00255 [Candidatus Woesearchaeota archaeon]